MTPTAMLDAVRTSVEGGRPLQYAAFLCWSGPRFRGATRSVTVEATTAETVEEQEGFYRWIGALGAALGATAAVVGADGESDGQDCVMVYARTQGGQWVHRWRHDGPRKWFPQESGATNMAGPLPQALALAVSCPGTGWGSAARALMCEQRHPCVLTIEGA